MAQERVGVRLDVDGGPQFTRTVNQAARSVDDLGDQAGGASPASSWRASTPR